MTTPDSSPPPLDQNATQELLELARRGDRGAREVLAARYLTRLRRWASGRLPQQARDMVDTVDIVQECLVRALDRLEGFELRHESAFQAYLHTAILNRIRNEARRVASRPPTAAIDGSEPDHQPSPLDEVIALELLEHYALALDRLSDEERAAIHLRVELGRDYDDIAAAMAKPSADAARMAVRRALDALAREMERVRSPHIAPRPPA